MLAMINPALVIKIPRTTLNPRKDFKLHAIFRAEVAGKIVSAPISTEPISFIPIAMLNANNKRKQRYAISGLAPIDFAKSGAAMLSVNRRERIRVKINIMIEAAIIMAAS